MPTWDQINDAREEGLVSLSRELAERFLREQPNDVPVLCLQIENLIDLSLYREAEELVTRARLFAPPEQVPWILTRRGYLFEGQGRFDAAVEVYLEAHDLNPNEAGHLTMAGVASLRLGAISIAIDFLTRATQCSEGAIDEAYFNLGGCYVTQRNYAEARKCFLRALEISPGYESAKLRLDDLERTLLMRHAETVSLHLMRPDET